MATKNIFTRIGKKSLALLMSLILAISVAVPTTLAADAYSLGDVAFTANEDTLPVGAIPALTKWEIVKHHAATYDCDKEEHDHIPLLCLFCSLEEHDHEQDGCQVKTAGRVEWKLVKTMTPPFTWTFTSP